MRSIALAAPGGSDGGRGPTDLDVAMLVALAERRFGVPHETATDLACDVVLSYLQTTSRITDVRAWSIAAMANACRHYRRSQGRAEELPPDAPDAPSDTALADRFTLRMHLENLRAFLRGRPLR
ncbi:MAG TPA: hypothetical protein VF824_22670 [Thermoanaerobaculia bacterium]|jgi:DNA-directed RNA polymerase specialized sigma24 family protein